MSHPATGTGIAVSAAMFPGNLDISGFLLINLIIMLIFYATSGISFFFSSLFDETKHSLAFGAAIPVAFFILKMLGDISDKGAWMGNLSLFSLLDPPRILAGDVTTAIAIPVCVALVFYAAAVLIFNRRSLPI